MIGPTYLSGIQLPPAGAPGGPLLAGALRSTTLRNQSWACSESTTRRTSTGGRRWFRKHRNHCNEWEGQSCRQTMDLASLLCYYYCKRNGTRPALTGPGLHAALS